MTNLKSTTPVVAVVMGSKSDEKLMEPAQAMLQELGIPFEVRVMSAHRTPETTREYARSAEDRGIEVIIAGAGAAAHLPGVIASWTSLPVIGVPLPTSDLKGMDSLLAMVQMPGGVPVAVMAIGTAGSKNAALMAAQILGKKFPEVREACAAYRKKLSEG